MSNKSASEVLDDYVAEFGEREGQVVRNLTDKVVNLTMRWQMFLYFFAGPHERVDVLNEASVLTAKVLQGLFWDDALMRIRQMTVSGAPAPWFRLDVTSGISSCN